MCVAKGLTGGYLPLAATFATQKIFDAFLGDPSEGKTFFHGHTYTANPLACAAALASLDLFAEHDLLAQVRLKSQSLATMLDSLRSLPQVAEVRQRGLMIGIELKNRNPTRRLGAQVCTNLRRRGVILRPLGDVVVIMPPLAIGVAQLKHIIQAITDEVSEL
jgi:adenosylmethionine-8-amino-7-oxononanoate aminotransferase